ncbi:bifunctional Vacuolar protein sorting-associated protein 33 [Babesia duncani]|uniref:Bifunctional Vacuolar protein sorting-associated protein 33 n=1 Tax=Babesia duncani TaxID=323732 RepID=A0AAD9PKG3_9APIC|nr:bifunctional Vacuolar protein sorting-associated protein 33 [Babesia duncani]
MFSLDDVARDARYEFFRIFAHVVKSLENFEAQKLENTQDASPNASLSNAESDAESELTLANGFEDPESVLLNALSKRRNAFHIWCTSDIRELVRRLFSDNELLDWGFGSINVISDPDTLNRQDSSPVNKEEALKFDIYLIRPTLDDAKLFKESISHWKFEFIALVCIPMITDMFPETLQVLLSDSYSVYDIGLGIPSLKPFGNVLVFACEIHVVPIESNVLSMFMSNCFVNYYNDGDPTIAWFFARAIEYLERRYLGGAITMLHSVGFLAKFVLHLLLQNRRDYAANFLLDCVKNNSIKNKGDSIVGISIAKCNEPVQDSLLDWTLLGISPEIDYGVIIDRRVDLITPMCSNFTYQGLLDSIVGIKNDAIYMDAAILEGAEKPPEILVDLFSPPVTSRNLKRISLDNSLYKEIKWMNYNDVGSYLHSRAIGSRDRSVPNSVGAASDLSTLGEMDEFVKKYKSQQREHLILSQHVHLMSFLSRAVSQDVHKLLKHLEDGILQGSIQGSNDGGGLANITAMLFKSTETTIEFVLDLIYWNVPLVEIYRLLILSSQTCNGIKRADFETLKRAIMFQYGFQELMTLEHLLKCGAISINATTIDPTRWQKLCRRLNLLVDQDCGISDYSGVFGGYAPLSLRLVQMLHVAQNSAQALDFELQLLQAPLASLKQEDVGRKTSNVHQQGGMFIGYLGGVTLGEIAAANVMAKRQPTKPLVILTTDVINYRSLIAGCSL